MNTQQNNTHIKCLRENYQFLFYSNILKSSVSQISVKENNYVHPLLDENSRGTPLIVRVMVPYLEDFVHLCRVFNFLCPFKVPFLSLSVLEIRFCVRFRALKMRSHVRPRASKMRCQVGCSFSCLTATGKILSA